MGAGDCWRPTAGITLMRRLLADWSDRNDLAVLNFVTVDSRCLQFALGVPLVVLAQAVLVVGLDPGQQVRAGLLSRVDTREEHRGCVVALDGVGSGLRALETSLYA